MDKKKYYNSISPLSVTRVPRVFLSLSCIGQPDREVNSDTTYYERVLKSYSIGKYVHAINTYACREERTERDITDGYYAREFINDVKREHKSIWIVCNGLQRCLTLLSIWDLFDDGVIRLPGINRNENKNEDRKESVRGYVSIGGKTEIIICKWEDSTIRMVSTSNYGGMELQDIYNSIGDELESVCCKLGEDSPSYPDVLSSQRAIGTWYKKLLINWKNEDCGTWKTTSSQLTHTIYRRKFLKDKITTVRPPAIDRLERSSLFGGRSDIWFDGDIQTWHSNESLRVKDYKPARDILNVESIIRLDISSMYPYIFSQYMTPGHCIMHRVKHANNELQWAVESEYIIIAAVRINTNDPEYPVRINDKEIIVSEKTERGYVQVRSKRKNAVEYGIGEFDTVLIGPELERAFNDGCIVHCYEYAVYNPSCEYMEFMNYLVARRYVYKKMGDKYTEQVYKMYGNSFGGKLAQKNCGWIDAPDGTISRCQWGEWYVINGDTRETSKYRAIAGYPQIWSKEDYSPKGRPAVWSFVCAVGRYIMRSIREQLPPMSILQQDTDGLYVTQEAVDTLSKRGYLYDSLPGSLRVVSTHKHIRFYDARHYIVDALPVMAGLTAGFRLTDGHTYIDTKESCIGSGKMAHAPKSISAMVRHINLNQETMHGRQTNKGWLYPYRVNNKSRWLPFSIDPMGLLFRPS